MKLTHSDALAYLQNRFDPIKRPVKYIAGFKTKTGRQVALAGEDRGKEVTVYVESDDWPARIPGISYRQRFKKDEKRIHSLKANAPALYIGVPIDRLTIPTMELLVALCDFYEEVVTKKPADPSNDNGVSDGEIKMNKEVSMNSIFYGPPGTGKTYATAKRAVEICGETAASDRKALMTQYERLRTDGRISFVTFHQSYGYEDFVEGLRPVIQASGQISYSVVPGAFRRACDSASLPKLVDPGLSGKPLKERKIYKMSLGTSWNDEGIKVFKYCLENQCVLMGWGSDVDFTECGNVEAIKEKLNQDAPGIEKLKSQVAFVDRFKNELKVGDILIISHGNKSFRGIAEVAGEYEFDEDGPFHQARPVKWLAVFESGRPASIVNEKDFTMRSLHQLHDVNYEGLKSILASVYETQKVQAQPHVLIIDEINRANISKVFGELITLLEPDKREGEINAITVKLPYSGESFCVPSNLYIVGTMNTADRSIALLDTALRRRFEFEELQADYTLLPTTDDGVDLGAMLKAMNERIEYLYDRDHTIGHAYFIDIKTLDDLDSVFRRKVIPLLQEYFYEDWSKVCLALNDSVGGFIMSSEKIPSGLGSATIGYGPKIRYWVNPAPFALAAYNKIYEES